MHCFIYWLGTEFMLWIGTSHRVFIKTFSKWNLSKKIISNKTHKNIESYQRKQKVQHTPLVAQLGFTFAFQRIYCNSYWAESVIPPKLFTDLPSHTYEPEWHLILNPLGLILYQPTVCSYNRVYLGGCFSVLPQVNLWGQTLMLDEKAGSQSPLEFIRVVFWVFLHHTCPVSHVGAERDHPETVPTNLWVWNHPKYLGLLKH